MSLLVNIFGAPGAGKSTTRAGVFHRLKLMGLNVEEVPEFAKDLTHEGRGFALSVQPYVFGKQLKAMERVRNKYDVIITDSPVLLSAFYGTKYETIESTFAETVRLTHEAMTPALNYLLERVKPYNPRGRTQTASESDDIAIELEAFLKGLGVHCQPLAGNENAVWHIVSDVLGAIKVSDGRCRRCGCRRVSHPIIGCDVFDGWDLGPRVENLNESGPTRIIKPSTDGGVG